MNAVKIRETFSRLVDGGVEGFTLTPDGEEYKPDKGYAVAYRTCKTLDDAIRDLMPYQFIGWWKDPLTNKEYIEVVEIYDSNFTACMVGLSRRQLAIYNFATDSIIDLSGLYCES